MREGASPLTVPGGGELVMDDDEACGAVLEIDGGDIVEFGKDDPVMTVPDVELMCSLPWGHLPPTRHSDGVNEWIGDVE